jgi:hypothetical protein
MADTKTFYPPIPASELKHCSGYSWDGDKNYIVDRIVITCSGDFYGRQITGNWVKFRKPLRKDG